MITNPEVMVSAAAQLATIGSDLNAAHLVAAAPTTALIPAAADEISTGVAALFSSYAANYQGLAGQAATFHEQFVGNLKSGAASYASIEAAIASFLQGLTADVQGGIVLLGFFILSQFTPLGPFYDVALLVFLAEQLLKPFGLL